MAEAQRKILCIEDDRETAKLIAEELSERGFCALIAYDGRVGLSAILRRIPDLVLCDVGVPILSGFEILSCMNECVPLRSRIPFVFLTGLMDRANELRARSLGAADYVTKPIDFDILETIIRARLASGAARYEMPAMPKRIDRKLAASLASRGLRPPGSGARGEIIEMFDAPTVDFRLDDTRADVGAAAKTDAAVNADNGLIRKL